MGMAALLARRNWIDVEIARTLTPDSGNDKVAAKRLSAQLTSAMGNGPARHAPEYHKTAKYCRFSQPLTANLRFGA
jgi:hypothetical protein